ncbi:MAG: hypothetical protein LAO24_07620 [Acidobacteriia bacterium]|nr:hypothetical protein [Terriglobia bacterium]
MPLIRRCNAVRFVAVLIFLLSISCGYAQQQNGAAEVTTSEYEVFSAYIAHYFVGKAAKERIGLPVSRIVIVDMTEYDESEIVEDTSWKQIQRYLRRQVPSLRQSTINTFRQMNREQAPLGPRFNLPLHYELVSASKIDSILHDISSWPEYYKQYPASQGFLSLSRVGFSPDGKQAIFYASNHCGGKCATGSFAVMEKRGAAWTVVKEVILWVS